MLAFCTPTSLFLAAIMLVPVAAAKDDTMRPSISGTQSSQSQPSTNAKPTDTKGSKTIRPAPIRAERNKPSKTTLSPEAKNSDRFFEQKMVSRKRTSRQSGQHIRDFLEGRTNVLHGYDSF
jgi:hypothetical protein